MKYILLLLSINLFAASELVYDKSSDDISKYKVVYECYAYSEGLLYNGLGISEDFEEAKQMAVDDCPTGACWVHKCNKTYGVYSKISKGS